MKNSAPVMLPVASTETNGSSSLYIGCKASGAGSGDKGKQNVDTIESVKGEVLAVQGYANTTSPNDNGISHPQSPTSNNPVSSLADANNDEREEKIQSPQGKDGQLPEGYIEQLGEHYATLPPEADEPTLTSDNATSDDSSDSPHSPKGIDEDEGTPAPPASPTPNIADAETISVPEIHQSGDD